MRRVPLVKALFCLAVSAWASGCKSEANEATPSPAGSTQATPQARVPSVTNLLVRLDKALQERAPKVRERLRPGASEAQISEFEAYFGAPLPASLKALYQWHDGVTTNANGVYAPPGLYLGYWLSSLQQVRETHAMKTGMQKDGTYKSTGRGGAGWWDPRWIPVFQNVSGGSLCVDMAGSFTGQRGQLVQEWHDDASRKVEYASLEAWLETYVAALEAGVLKATSDEPTSIEASDIAGEEGPRHEAWLLFHKTRNPGFPRLFRAEGGH